VAESPVGAVTIQFKQAAGPKDNQRIDVVVVKQLRADAVVADYAETSASLIPNRQVAVGQDGTGCASRVVQTGDTRGNELIISVQGKRVFKPGLAEQHIAGAGQTQILGAGQQSDAIVASRQFIGLLIRLIPGRVVEDQDLPLAAQEIQGSQGTRNGLGQETSLVPAGNENTQSIGPNGRRWQLRPQGHFRETPALCGARVYQDEQLLVDLRVNSLDQGL
jgi:hypothetical protein